MNAIEEAGGVRAKNAGRGGYGAEAGCGLNIYCGMGLDFVGFTCTGRRPFLMFLVIFCVELLAYGHILASDGRSAYITTAMLAR